MIFDLYGHDRPLSEEIQEAEQRLKLRRSALRDEIRMLDLSVRERVTSPDVLLWGVATGFVVGELTKKQSTPPREPAPATHTTEAPHEEARPPGTLRLLLRYWAIARPIVAGASTFLSPYLQKMGERAARDDAVDTVGEDHVTQQAEPA